MKRKDAQPIDVTQAVMSRIKSGEVRMRPRLYYTIISVLAVCGGILLGLVLAYATSIVILWLRIQQAAGPAYGARNNLSTATNQFPWVYLAIALLLLGLLVYGIRRFGTLYRFRWQSVLLVVVACSLLLGLGLSYSSLTAQHVNQSNSRYCQKFPENCTK